MSSRWSDDRPTRRTLAIPVLTGVALLVIVAVAAVVSSILLARAEARQDAIATATRLADVVIGPPMVRRLAGDQEAAAEMDRLARRHVPSDPVLEFTVWSVADRRVVFSNASTPAPVAPRDDQMLVGRDGRGAVAELTRSVAPPGGRSPRPEVVDTFAPIEASAGQLLLEVHYSDTAYHRRVTSLTTVLVALALAPLLLVQLSQVPIVVSVMGRAHRRLRRRAALLRYALSASDRERREIAAGLHDRVVQNLAGAGYALSSLERDVPDERRPGAEAALSSVQASVASLRGLLVDLNPEALTGSGLRPALDALLGPWRDAGADVTLDVETHPLVPDDVAAAVYRLAREWLAHLPSDARTVVVDVGSAPSGVVLRITDDGHLPATSIVEPGLDESDEPAHPGLALLSIRAAGFGGSVRAFSRTDEGTVVVVAIPRADPG